MLLPREFVSRTVERTTFEQHIPAPIFRKQFELDALPEAADILISGLGFYDLWINGELITKGFLAPYISNTDDLVYYDHYDVKDKLQIGENVIGVMLGTGMQNPISTVWDFDHAIYNSAPKFAFSFTSDTLTFTAKDFVSSTAEITFDNYRSGVHCDARLKKDGWNDVGFDQRDWDLVVPVDTPRGEPRLCEADPILISQEIKAVSVKPGKLLGGEPKQHTVVEILDLDIIPVPIDQGNGYIYDFGINTAGVFRLKIKGEKGQRIVLQFSERLTDGACDPTNISYFFPEGYGQRDVYICRGDKEGEEYVPPFVYHGFRYIYVSGISEEQAGLDLLTVLELHSDLKPRASINSSSDVVNQLFDITKRSVLTNFHYFPTDCPHREKNGWTGDASISAEHMILTLGVEDSWTEWMRSVVAAQNDLGALPGIVPTTGWGFEWGNGPVWDSVLFTLPYYAYVYRGDTRMMEESSHAMLRYLSYVATRRDERGIIEIGLGDWCPVGREPDDYNVPLGFTDSATIVECCRMAVLMFEVLGLDLHASFAKQLKDELREAIRDEYLDTSRMLIRGYSQSGQAIGLAYGIFDDGEKVEACRRLVELIEQDGGSMQVGFVGGRVLFHVLSDFGYTDLAFKMITKPDYPSYGNLLERGATTLWEMFVPEGERSGSENHHFWGDINHWFLRQLLGLNINPRLNDPNHILVQPHFVEQLEGIEGSYDAPGGSITVKWTRDNEHILLEIKTTGTLTVDLQLDQAYLATDNWQRFRCLEGDVHLKITSR